MRIGELARKTGVSVRMLRYYERQGLLTPRRTAAGYRMYANGDTERVRRIVLLNRAGLSLATLRPVIACEVPGSADFHLCVTRIFHVLLRHILPRKRLQDGMPAPS